MQVAAEYSADMIAVGAHGERPGLQEALGSTAQHLVRTSSLPVLLVTHPRLKDPSHVLVPVDKSEHAGQALRWAATLSQRLAARVTALHVVTSGVASGALAAAAVISGTPPIDTRMHVATTEMAAPDRVQ